MRIEHSSYNNYLKGVAKRVESKRFFAPILLNQETMVFPLEGKDGLLVLSASKQNPLLYYMNDDVIFYSSLTNKFYQKWRSVIGPSIIESISLRDDDYVIDIEMQSTETDEKFHIHFEMIPLKANIVLANSQDEIIAVMSKEQNRNLGIGCKYGYPKQEELSKGGSPIKDELVLEHFASDLSIRKKQKYGELEQFLKRKIRTSERRLIAIKDDVEKAKDNLKYIDIADTILSSGENLRHRLSSIKIDENSIELDPSITVLENVQRFYKRARKAKETIARSTANAESAINDATVYRDIMKEYLNSDERRADKLLIELGLDKKHRETHETSFNAPFKINRFGTFVYFGKNASQNDYLSFAMKLDREYIWLHIKDIPGSHIVIASRNPSDDLILFSCEVALSCSRQTAGKIIMAKKKNVRRGKVLGEAIVKNQSVLTVSGIRPESEVLIKTAVRVETKKDEHDKK